jgi:NADH-quinone oxidoreductase subunit E
MDTHAATSTGPKQADQIPADLLAKIDEAVTHYPVSKRSASLPLLHLWQNHFGFIDDSGVNWIAARLDLEPINILELVTFYPWFRQEAPGKTIIRVCRTLSCALAGLRRPRKVLQGDRHRSLCKWSSSWPSSQSRRQV